MFQNIWNSVLRHLRISEINLATECLIFLKILKFPVSNPGFLNLLPGILENLGFPGRIPGFLNLLIWILDFLDNLLWSCGILEGIFRNPEDPSKFLTGNPGVQTLGSSDLPWNLKSDIIRVCFVKNGVLCFLRLSRQINSSVTKSPV